jgi:hypothetical protein
VLLPGRRVLIAEHQANRVTERDFQGKILWQKEVSAPVNVQRLPKGHTFIAGYGGPILEVDRAGKEIYSINNVPGRVAAARRSRRGAIVCLTQDRRCLRLDTTGRQLGSFAGNDASNGGNLDLLPNGHVLIAQNASGAVVEYDDEGKRVRQWVVPDVRTASPLPNGNLLVADGKNVRELDRTGKIVWEFKGEGPGIYRARRR